MSKRIFINALNSKAGGGKTILLNLLEEIPRQSNANEKYVLIPNDPSIQIDKVEGCHIFKLPRFLQSDLILPFTYVIVLPLLLFFLRIDIVFNLADLIIRTRRNQIYLFDWPYAVYPDSEVWNFLSFTEHLKRRIKLFFIRRYISYPICIIAQSEAMSTRLNQYFKQLNDIRIIPNATWFKHPSNDPFPTKLPSGRKLIYLTRYYPHKNIEVLVSVAKLIKKHGTDFKIILTLDEHDPEVRNIIGDVRHQSLSEIIVNIGPVPPEQVTFIYNNVDALIMPTLLETYGLPYIESMAMGKTILTSDLDFAHAVCREAAFYFNPKDPSSIYQTIEYAFSNPQIATDKKAVGKTISAELPTSQELISMYFKTIEEFANTRKSQ